MSRLLFFLSIVTFLYLTALVGNSAGNIDAPLVHWELDGDGRDSVGDSHLEIHDGDFVEGKYGQALSLDGLGAYAVDEDGADYINGLEAITIAMWIESRQTNTDKGFLVGREPDGSDKYLCIRYDVGGANGGGTNVIKTGVNTGQGKTTLESSNDVQVTEWQHVAMVWSSGEQIKLYINGVQDEPTANEAPIGGELFDFTKVILGKGAKDSDAVSWDGLIDDVYIYPTALSDREIIDVMEGRALSVNIHKKLTTTWGSLKSGG